MGSARSRARVRAAATLVALAAASLLALGALVTLAGWVRTWWGAIAAIAAGALAVVVARRLRRRVPSRTILELDLTRGVVEQVPRAPGGRYATGRAWPLRDLVDALARAAGDDRVAGLIARVGGTGLALAHAQELRDAVAAFRRAGKRAVAFAETFGEAGDATVDYSLAAAFDEVWLQPGGELSIVGTLTTAPFLRGLLDKLGVHPDLDHREEYKAAMYLFTEREMPGPQREATEALQGDHFDQIVAGIAADRSLDQAAVRAAIDAAPLGAEDAVAAGLVDGLGYRDEVWEAATGGGRLLFLDRYLARAGRPHRKGAKVALVHATGTVTRGRSRFSLLPEPGFTMGSDDVVGAFREAAADDAVQAVVFRVSTPGGSAVGSEAILGAVVRARDAGKPVVASLGPVAASGGYYVAARCDRIVAQPGTVTGSIGVVSGKLITDAALARAGVTAGHVAHGAAATYFSSRHPYDEVTRPRLQASLDRIYQRFRSHVAAGRSLTDERVAEIAKGRVWTGRQGQDLGLVDELGGLDTALAAARELAGLPPDAGVKLVEFPVERRRLPWRARRESSEALAEMVRATLDVIGPVAEAAGAVQPEGVLRLPPGSART